MKPFHVAVVGFVVLAACSSPNNPTRPMPQGEGTQIAFENGTNCWNNQCLRFNKANRAISVTGRYPVSVPRNIDVRDGYVSDVEFAAMYTGANRALARGAGSR
jgi:hypothetical protein